MARSFYPLQDFAPKPSQVSLVPFHFTRLHGQELLVNEAGEFLFGPDWDHRRIGRWQDRHAINAVQGSEGETFRL